MSPKWKILLFAMLLAASAAGAVASVIMLVTAVRFGEWGRVLLYLLLSLICLEAAGVSVAKLWKIRKVKT